MTVTVLDSNTALVVIDLQAGIASLATAHPMADVIRRAAHLATTFRKQGLPVVLVNVDGGAPGRTEQPPRMGAFPPGWTELVPELDRQPEDHVVTKRTWGAFPNTDLDAHLKGLGVTEIVLAGVATSIGVETTAREAYALGYNIALAVDAMTDMSAQAHDNSIARIFPRLGQTGTTQEIVDLVNTRA